MIAGTVLVQSQHEKDLAKKLRKSRKNEMKMDKGNNEEFSWSNFDPKLLRVQRELELQDAKRRPLFSGPHSQTHLHASDLYPHVYDELGKIKLVAASIGQFNLSLPSNVVRRETIVSLNVYFTSKLFFRPLGVPKVS